MVMNNWLIKGSLISTIKLTKRMGKYNNSTINISFFIAIQWKNINMEKFKKKNRSRCFN